MKNAFFMLSVLHVTMCAMHTRGAAAADVAAHRFVLAVFCMDDWAHILLHVCAFRYATAGARAARRLPATSHRLMLAYLTVYDII